MKRKYTYFMALGLAVILVANEMNPPDGRTGAPGDGLCSDCHSLNGGAQDGSITLAGFPSSIVPSQAYVLTITNSNPNGVADLAGFQMVVLNSSNQNAGTFSGPDANSALDPSGGRTYWEHRPAQSYPGSNAVTWTVTWTAPAGPANEAITWYAAGNVANGSGTSEGDLIVTNLGSGMLAGGIEPLEAEIVSSTDVTCNGAFTGSATAGATGGVQPYGFAWSNGQSGPMAEDLGAGTYTVTVTDNVGTTATASVVITQPSAITFGSPAITPVSCFGEADGAITTNVSGGVPPFEYNWSNGASSSSISGLAAGNYGLTVTDDNGCTKTTSYTVTQPALLVINLVDLEDESCFGENDGSITISAAGGTTPYFAEWSNGFIGNTVNGLEPGTYSVTVTDANDCTATAEYDIAAGSQVDVDLESISHVTCFLGNDGSIEVSGTGGAPPYSYLWSTGATTPLVTGLSAGNYLLTTTDDNGCDIVKAYTINQPDLIVVAVTQTASILCFGDSTATLVSSVFSGGVPPFTTLWSTGAETTEITGVPAGVYGVTMTDATGCIGTALFNVTQPAEVLAAVATTDETAPGANDGTAIVMPAGGTGPYTFLWSTGSTQDTLTGLAPGVYSVTVTDASGCTGTGQGQVDPFGCTLDVELGADLSICAGTTGLFVPGVTGATGLVLFSWSTGETNDTISVSAAGEYCVSVVDESGCQDADCIIISLDTVPLLTCGVNHESAPGANDGSIICEPNGEIIAYLWNTGATTLSITDLPPGEYCVTLTNANGCSAEQCFIVQAANCNLVITAIQQDVLCFGDTTGAIALNVMNGAFPISYLWSTGDTTSAILNIGAGAYDVTISDAAGCTEIRSFAVTQPEVLFVAVDSTVTIGPGQPGALYITVTGGVQPYAYSWTYPNGSGTSTDEDLTGLVVPGGYILTVTDVNGCGTVGLFEVMGSTAVPNVPRHQHVNVYPVPATDWLQLVLPVQAAEVWLTGIDGRILRQYDNPTGNRIDVSGIESGWYVLTIHDGTSCYVARMVK